MTRPTTLRTCSRGHAYYKSGSCPVCPLCEAAKKPADGFPAGLPAPARRALANAGIRTLQQLAAWSEEELLQLHGLGPRSLPLLSAALQAAGLRFRPP